MGTKEDYKMSLEEYKVRQMIDTARELDDPLGYTISACTELAQSAGIRLHTKVLTEDECLRIVEDTPYSLSTIRYLFLKEVTDEI